jgi:hypothetical protein
MSTTDNETIVVDDKTTLGKMETLKHIQAVRSYIYLMLEELDARARNHDQSKLESPEAEIFGEFGPLLKDTKYGSPEYEELLTKVKPATDNHYAKNRHHPEHWPRGINDMTLIDLVEMLADWKAATARNKDGNIRTSIKINAKRFGMSDQLAQIMQNTVREMFKR